MRFRFVWNLWDTYMLVAYGCTGLGIIFCISEGGLALGIVLLLVGILTFVARILYLKNKTKKLQESCLQKISQVLKCSTEERDFIFDKIVKCNYHGSLINARTDEEILKVIRKVKPEAEPK